MILAGDIGGTHSRLALFETTSGRLTLVTEESFPSREFPGLEDVVSKFLHNGSGRNGNIKVDAACFGIAGPVQQGRAQVSNLPWIVESAQLSRDLKVSALLINDLEANAWGVELLASTDLVTINQGVPGAVGNQAVVSAGTGLGEAGLYWDGCQHHAFACEGGHADFAPRNDIEIELLRYLRAKFDRVSYERVLSGPGLINIHLFLRDTRRGEEPSWLREQMQRGDPAAAISKAALEGRSPLAERALDLFVEIYGAEAGNLALKLFATGGVFIGGGIAPKILPKLKTRLFLDAFVDKGRLRPVLEAIPIHVIVNENAALLGAARCAAVWASRHP
jgi:glucokinase